MRKALIIEPHPDDALASASGVLFSNKIDCKLITVSRTNDERDNINLVKYMNSEKGILRKNYSISSHIKCDLPDLHWDYHKENKDYDELVEEYKSMYCIDNINNWKVLLKNVGKYIAEAKDEDALIIIPLALLHPFHILVMEACCDNIILHDIKRENIVFYVDHPYDYFSAGTGRVFMVKKHVEYKLNMNVLHVDCNDIDQNELSEIIKDIYGEVHYGEFAGTLEKTKCSLMFSDNCKIKELIGYHLNNVLYVSSQAKPYNKTGGMGEVVYQLAHSVKENANDVRILLFRYDVVDDSNIDWTHIEQKRFEYINGYDSKCECILDTYIYDDIIYYVLDIVCFDEKYALSHNDESEAYAVTLCDAFVAVVMKHLDYNPTVIHCHDWQTACIPFFSKTVYQNSDYLKNIVFVYTIHFYGYRGIINREKMKELLGLDNRKCNLCLSCSNKRCHFEHIKYLLKEDAELLHIDNEYVTCMSAGIQYADYVTTVSEGYANELQGIPDFSKNRLIGIRNGIKIEEKVDTESGFCKINEFNYKEAKLINKRALQRKVGLDVTPEYLEPDNDKVPLIGLLTRLSVEKGMPDLLESLDELLKMDVQVLIVGDEPNGKQFYVPLIEEFVKKYPGKMQYLPYDSKLEFEVYSGIDILLMPSLSEACGTSQMMAMNYGVLPALTMISSFQDTVTSYFEQHVVEKGIGFYFFIEDGHTMLSAIRKILVEFKSNKEKWHWCMWKNIVTRFSWEELSLRKYLDLYDKTYKE